MRRLALVSLFYLVKKKERPIGKKRTTAPKIRVDKEAAVVAAKSVNVKSTKRSEVEIKSEIKT